MVFCHHDTWADTWTWHLASLPHREERGAGWTLKSTWAGSERKRSLERKTWHSRKGDTTRVKTRIITCHCNRRQSNGIKGQKQHTGMFSVKLTAVSLWLQWSHPSLEGKRSCKAFIKAASGNCQVLHFTPNKRGLNYSVGDLRAALGQDSLSWMGSPDPTHMCHMHWGQSHNS